MEGGFTSNICQPHFHLFGESAAKNPVLRFPEDNPSDPAGHLPLHRGGKGGRRNAAPIHGREGLSQNADGGSISTVGTPLRRPPKASPPQWGGGAKRRWGTQKPSPLGGRRP